MAIGILVCYFSQQSEAAKAQREVTRQGFRRSALIHRGMAGDAYSVVSFLRGHVGGVNKTILHNHLRCIMPGESALLIQASVDSLQIPVTMLRENSAVLPTLFIMHPRQERRMETRTTTTKLSLGQLQAHAQHHAAEQRLELNPQNTGGLTKRLKQSRLWFRHVCADLAAADRLEQKTTPTADWILDNEYILESNSRDILLNLPRQFYKQLPILDSERYKGFPCIYEVAKDLVSHTELRLDRENILTFIQAHQSVRTLTIGEIWAMPQMLRIALIENIQNLAVTALSNLRERQLAEFWANRLISANHRDSNQLFAILAELTKSELSPTPYFGTQLISLLYDEAAALAPVLIWLERTHKTALHDLNQREQNRQNAEQLSCGNAFTSLRLLALLDWRELFEKLSRVDQILRNDPSGVYDKMDFASRDSYRRALESLARTAKIPEENVAELVVKLATQAGRDPDSEEQMGHVGTWLVGKGRAELIRMLPCRDTIRYRFMEWLHNRHEGVYAAGIIGLTALFFSSVGSVGSVRSVGSIELTCLFLLLLVPLSQLAIENVNYLITRLLPPHILPKMNYEETGIPDSFRTLVVVPMMLTNVETVQGEIEKLEIRSLANKETNLLFSLFTDYTDSSTATTPDDQLLLNLAITGLDALNQRHGTGRFFLFHRERTWSISEQKFIGWERKRGKLEELNQLIDGTRHENAARLVHVGDAGHLTDIRFIITLDSDTQLPHASARRMVETLAHPLNQPRFSEDGKLVAGYTIIQPRVSPTLTSTSASTFSRLFADAVGIDPYTQAVSDVYQDLSGEGSYHGKGIYDVRAFSRLLTGRFPDACILSHDLIEGAYVRVGLASDIELYDEFPQGYQSYSRRSHRWIRGDWQIAGWILPCVPHASGRRAKNPLTRLNRWKILDNLRRSLLPVASLGLLVAAWFLSEKISAIASLVVGTQLLFHPLAHPLTMATSRRGLRFFSPVKLLHDLLRAIADAALLPHQASVAMDAIVRVWYRKTLSQRDLLEWTTQATNGSVARQQPLFIATLAAGSIFSIILGAVILRVMPASLPFAAPWLLLWFFSPLLGWYLNQRPGKILKTELLPESDLLFLRQVARRTWRYFSEFVNADTSWLPPDNYQVAHQNRCAMRTSPTNIGLWLTSVLGAHDSGYITVNQVIEKLVNSMATIDRLVRHEGHLLNWYDIQTLAPLEPRYVSTVDSGNLLGALWVLEQGLEELLHVPLLNSITFSALADTGEILKKSLVEKGRSDPFDPCLNNLEKILTQWHAAPDTAAELLHLQHQTQDTIDSICTTSFSSPWSVELKQQVSSWVQNNDRYLAWMTILAELSDRPHHLLNEATLAAIHRDLRHAPSLIDLARGQIGAIMILTTLQEELQQAGQQPDPWIQRVVEAYSTAQWLAGETLGMAQRLIVSVRELSAGINMHFLYDPKRKLFTIGYNVSLARPDNSSYDLLASEARLGSFVSIARGDIPLEHWFSLGRPYGAIGRQRVLLSWTGTMFEYLMPLLFQHSYDHSLLDKAAREAVANQIAYGLERGVPWGISESAFADLDLAKNYQYRAFGVPALGLKRCLDEKLVVAPYATLLALGVAPVAALQNLKRLNEMGMLSHYGYYEAMDFSRQPHRETGRQSLKRGVIVEAYMAHHQGMAFLSLTNFLRGNPFQRRFHGDQRVRAFDALLQERIPALPPLQLISTRQSEHVMPGGELVSPAGITFTTPHTATPRTLLLSNGRYGLMVTNSGGGYSQWGNRELTRWRSDQSCDSQGSFCYIYETETNHLWSSTYHPVGGDVTGYSVEFTLDRAVFSRIDQGIHTETEMVVSPDDDVEIRRITLINRSAYPRHLNLTSYIELSLAPHNADRQHPAFNKLFIQTEALDNRQALLAHRRARNEAEQPLFVAHCLKLEKSDRSDGSVRSDRSNFEYETDRGRFIGRGRTLANPMGAVQTLGNSQGFVLDPILAVRKSFTLEPGQRVQVLMILAAGETSEQVLLLTDKYCEHQATERALDLAWGSAQQQLQLLHIQPDEARRFQELASHLLFPNRYWRTSVDRLEDNRKGQAGLWPYAISGDLPLLLITIGEIREINLIRQLLQAHAYWNLHGLATDLVILNEEPGSYEQPLKDRLDQLIRAHVLSVGNGHAGKIFLKNSAVIPDEDLILLKAAASIVLVAARGTLPQQLALPMEAPELPELLSRKRTPREPSAPLPFMELKYFNSLGGFTPDGREYAIYLGPGTNTPAPWVNVIANPGFGTIISETGAGFTWYGNSQRNRLSSWSNDPVLDPASEAIYIRDEENGDFWSPTATPIREDTAYRARHGAGYTIFEHNSNGIEQELIVFVPVDEHGGKPIKLQRLHLTNATSRRRKLSVTYYVELTLGENRETSQMHIITRWDDTAGALLARNHYHPEYGDRITFVAMSPGADSYGGDRTSFIGRNRSLTNPVALEAVDLSKRVGAGLDPCAALRISVELAPGEKRDISCMLGQTDSLTGVRELIAGFRDDQEVLAAFHATRSWWDDLLGTIEVHTPELATDLLLNRWLQYQTLSCRIWGRSGFYQSGGAYGFRDQLQDVMAFFQTRPALARDQILRAAGRQFREGDVQHWWHPPGGAGIRSRISDDLLWLPYVVARYVVTTGDLDILHTELPFLCAPLLTDEQHELFSLPEVSPEKATLFEHCVRATARGLTVGPHGLPLMGTGDWNDGMNLVGAGGKGESVWLAWFLCETLQGMARLAALLHQPEQEQAYREERLALIRRTELAGWDGQWYLRGTFDDGSPLGSATNNEARIDSLPQSWAWLSGAADPVRADKALESAWEHLVRADEGLVLLFEPPFETCAPSPGYIKGYPPGVRENGGQYTHAALWMAMAMARKGDGERAVHLLRMLNPIEHARNAEAVWQYGVEPYVVAADVYRLPGRVGQGGWSWYTGSAAWMYRAWIEEVLGLEVRGVEMRINPVIPCSWSGFSLNYRHGKTVYFVQVENPDGFQHGVAWVELDGQRLPGGVIQLEQALVKHHVTVRMGNPEQLLPP